ncbi:MAG TPA: tRNA (5-methylaminomethyl-2-thiouridine)(34)-methyltransferase MnmD [Bacteroidales bacterium]|nr:tRNA (5-methylaminomethyl-2-thiouridine)(34)-methyltransferase MnmD [Bacteroidales bacterium]
MSSKRELRITGDSSYTLWDADYGEHFHSGAGAIGESMHVFVQNGLNFARLHFPDALNILEMGFGTGLNALLTCLHKQQTTINYTGIEKHPLPEEVWRLLQYEQLEHDGQGMYYRIMQAEWNIPQRLHERFCLLKYNLDILDYHPDPEAFHLVYFDAFSPAVVPELWSDTVFGRLFGALKPQGVLVTYSAKGDVKRALRNSGFKVERLPGFAGKRHMIRAVKP